MVNEYGRVIAYNISNLQAPYLIGITESITRYDCIGILGNRVFCTGYRNGSNYLDEYSIDPLGTLDFVAEMSMQFQASKIVPLQTGLPWQFGIRFCLRHRHPRSSCAFNNHKPE
jgi:hypothetical protein